MRRYTKAILLMLVALFYAGTAGAVAVSVEEVSVGSVDGMYLPTENVEVDIIIDTEGILIYGFTLGIQFDDTVLSPISAVNNPVTNLTPGYYSPYLYPSGLYPTAPAAWYIGGSSGAGVSGLLNVATLVFHVMDVPASTLGAITPSTEQLGFTEMFILAPAGVKLVEADMTMNGLTVHVPEPTTTMLIGLGLFGILYAGRRR